ncbi:MFS transporter [Shewanella phaeophyticola]|uniref:MFS transporter n=1 Tax=Shewanella phaeophyticola TaxID=2978345 RepID=A0ABT2P6P8_9GAMM|nr:MFS transporter [Shewanella sp. KJ10-1]MCT8988336.1 MFS transporter [Shewanella sp. KJ10-1]
MKTKSEIPVRGWSILSVAWLTFSISNLANFAFGVILPDMRSDIGFDLQMAGYLSAIAWVGKGLLTIPIICCISKGRPKTVLFCIFVLSGLGMLFQGYATNTYMLFLGRLLVMGVAAGIVSVLVVFKIQWIPKEKMGMVNGIEVFTSPIGQLLGTAGFPIFLAMIAGWRDAMLSMGYFVLLLAFVWLFVAKERDSSLSGSYIKVPMLQPLKEALAYRNTWLLALAWPATSLTWIAIYTFWASYAVESLNFSISEAGIILGFMPIGSAIACLASPLIAQVLGYDKPLIIASGIVLPCSYFGLMLSDNITILSSCSFICGYAAYNFVPIALTMLYKTGMSPRAVSMATGFIFSLVGFGGAIGAVLSGYLSEHYGIEFALLVLCIAPIIFVIFTVFLTETGWKTKSITRTR